jgi:tricorn protease
LRSRTSEYGRNGSCSGTNLENYGVPPDVYVDNTPEDFLKGRDAQLEKAVTVLQEELKK